VVGGEVEVDAAAVGDLAGVLEGFGDVLEERDHLLGALDVELLGIVQARVVGLVLAGGDADEGVVRVPVVGGEEVGVVVADEGEGELLGEAEDVAVDRLLLSGVVALQLEEEARLALLVGGEQLGVPERLGFRPLPVLLGAGAVELAQVVGDRGSEVAVDGDQPLVPLGERPLVHARLEVEALAVGVAGELEQVVPAGLVLGEQHQVEAAVGHAQHLLAVAVAVDQAAVLLGIGHAVGGDVGLDAQDRLDPLLPALLVEGDRAEQVAVVGERHRVHAELLNARDQLGDAVPAVEQRVLGVQVEVDVAGARGRGGGGALAGGGGGGGRGHRRARASGGRRRAGCDFGWRRITRACEHVRARGRPGRRVGRWAPAGGDGWAVASASRAGPGGRGTSDRCGNTPRGCHQTGRGATAGGGRAAEIVGARTFARAAVLGGRGAAAGGGGRAGRGGGRRGGGRGGGRGSRPGSSCSHGMRSRRIGGGVAGSGGRAGR
jgi:hypothetical protein